MMVPDYDAADAAPATEQIASAYRDAEEEVPWTPEFSCELNVAAMHPDGRRKFVRYGALANNLDIKTYDVGNMFICTTDGTATNWGKLWVEYDISLFVPQLQPGGLALNPAGGSFSNGGSITAAQPFGSAPVANAANVGVTMTASTNNVLTFASTGTYLVTLYLTSTTATGFNLTAGSGMTLTTLQNVENGSNTGYLDVLQIVTTTTNAQLQVAATSASVTSAAAYIAIAPANSL